MRHRIVIFAAAVSLAACSGIPGTSNPLSSGSPSTTPGTPVATSTVTPPRPEGRITDADVLVPGVLTTIPDPPLRPTYHVMPQGQGSRSGLSWDDAAPLQNLPDLVRSAGPGGEIWLRGDVGEYELKGGPITIDAGGANGRPVVIRGVGADGPGTRATLRGQRANPWEIGERDGEAAFRLERGADHVVFTDLEFVDIGNGAIQVVGDVRDLRITSMRAANIQRFLENRAGRNSTATINGLLLKGVEVRGYSKGVMRLESASHDVLVEDVVGDSEYQDGDQIALGFTLSDGVHNVVFRNVRMSNHRDSTNDYWNGDGWSTERDVHDVWFVDTYSSGSADAGYDLKSTATYLLRATAEGNKRNFRFWADTIAQDCVGLDPEIQGGSGTQAQVQVSEEADVQLFGCTFTDDDPDTQVFDVDGGRLRVTDSSVETGGTFQDIVEGAILELTDVAGAPPVQTPDPDDVIVPEGAGSDDEPGTEPTP